MKKILIGIAAVVGIYIACFAIANVLEGGGLAFYTFWAPKEQAAQRKVYQETPQFINGNRQALMNQLAEIQRTTDPDAKATLRAALRTQVNGLPEGAVVPAEVSTDLANNP
jgi:hypothetical protein